MHGEPGRPASFNLRSVCVITSEMMGSDGMAPATTYESAAPVVGLCLGILGSPFALVCVSYPHELNRSPCLAGRLLRKELHVACTEHSSIIGQAHILTSLFPKLPRCLACILPNFQCIRRRVRQHKVARWNLAIGSRRIQH